MSLNQRIYAYARFSYTCIFLRTVDITSAQFVTRTWFELLADTQPCSHELPVPELQLLDSSSHPLPHHSVRLSRRLPLSARPQKCLIATRVCTTVYGAVCDGIVFLYLSLFYSGFILPYDERKREMAIRIYMLGTFIYAGKPVRLTINHMRLYTRLFLRPHTHHPPLRFFYPWSGIQ